MIEWILVLHETIGAVIGAVYVHHVWHCPRHKLSRGLYKP